MLTPESKKEASPGANATFQSVSAVGSSGGMVSVPQFKSSAAKIAIFEGGGGGGGKGRVGGKRGDGRGEAGKGRGRG